LPENYRGASWEKACTETRKRCNDWKKAATDISRNPEDPVKGLLSLSEPLLPIFRAVDKLDEAAAKAAPGSLHEATLKRDALLLSMLVANPLRARNYVLMTYREDQTGNLYRREDGQWRIRFGPGDFKNDRHGCYDAPLPRSLAARIEEYVAEFRPRLLAKDANAPWVFPNSLSKKWLALNRQVERITRQYIPESHGFAPHALRHLVATDYLRKHPGHFLTVAELLHNTLDTVLRIYAHLKQDDSFGKYEEHLNAIKLH
jgi:integrase